MMFTIFEGDSFFSIFFSIVLIFSYYTRRLPTNIHDTSNNPGSNIQSDPNERYENENKLNYVHPNGQAQVNFSKMKLVTAQSNKQSKVEKDESIE